MSNRRKSIYRRAALVVGLLALTTTSCHSFLKELDRRLVEARAIEQFDEVRDAAEEYVDEEPPNLLRPSLIVSERSINLTQPMTRQYLELGLDQDDPWRMPFQAQVETELLRKAFQEVYPNDLFWEASLAKADTVVIRALRNILEVDDPSELARHLAVRNAEIDDSRINLQAATKRFAEEREYRFNDNLSMPMIVLPDPFEVQVFTQPEGGVVRILPLLAYRKEEIRGVSIDMMPWKTVLQNPDELIGLYEYWITWPQTDQEARGRTHVRNDSPLTFRPESPPER